VSEGKKKAWSLEGGGEGKTLSKKKNPPKSGQKKERGSLLYREKKVFHSPSWRKKIGQSWGKKKYLKRRKKKEKSISIRQRRGYHTPREKEKRGKGVPCYHPEGEHDRFFPLHLKKKTQVRRAKKGGSSLGGGLERKARSISTSTSA